MVRFFYVKYTKILSLFLVAEVFAGLIYHRPPAKIPVFSSIHSLLDDGRSISQKVANKTNWFKTRQNCSFRTFYDMISTESTNISHIRIDICSHFHKTYV